MSSLFGSKVIPFASSMRCKSSISGYPPILSSGVHGGLMVLPLSSSNRPVIPSSAFSGTQYREST